MKKYPSYTTITTYTHQKKPLQLLKYQKPEYSNGLISVRNISHHKKENGIKLEGRKYNQPLINKNRVAIERRRTEINENNNGGEDKYEYEILKNRLNALEDRLVEIKKSYELRKNRGQNYSTEKGGSSQKNATNVSKQNEKTQKLIPHYKKRSNINLKPNSKQQESFTQRLTVQSPKSSPLQQLNGNKTKLQSKQETNLNCDQILSQYVTQYEQKPIAFKHTTSEVNLLKPSQKKKLIENGTKQKYTDVYYISAIIRALETPKPTSFDQICTSHIVTSYQFLCYVKNAGIQKPCKSVIKALPPPTKKITIIFDLDQTLIHCLDPKQGATADISLPVLFPDRNQVTVGINIRPYTKECLKQLSQYFEIMVFTASHENYANAIVDYLDPQKQYISHKFSRENCHKTQQGFYVKDLRVVDRKLSNILLVDNAAYSYCFQPENGIPIVPFYDNKADLQLKNLIPYLKSFLNQSDVRVRNTQIMKINQYTKFKNAEDLISGLYR